MATGLRPFLENAQHQFVQNKMNNEGGKENNAKDNHKRCGVINFDA
jgi:hypothetical protein